MKISTISATVLLLLSLAGPAAALDTQPSCQALQAWVEQLEKLPTDYESFSLLTEVERKLVYGRLSSAERSALWQRHWQEALASGGLAAGQRALVEEAGRLMSVDTFAALKTAKGEQHDAARAAVRAFEARVASAFGEAAATALFYRLGTPPAAPEAARAFRCYCSVGAQDCEPGMRCDPGGCQIRLSGCGLFYEEVCDGQCYYL